VGEPAFSLLPGLSPMGYTAGCEHVIIEPGSPVAACSKQFFPNVPALHPTAWNFCARKDCRTRAAADSGQRFPAALRSDGPNLRKGHVPTGAEKQKRPPFSATLSLLSIIISIDYKANHWHISTLSYLHICLLFSIKQIPQSAQYATFFFTVVRTILHYPSGQPANG
jgi:hypothetical protein